MAIEFKILPHRNLVYIGYRGKMGIEESRAGAEAFAVHPDFRPELRHLVDLSRVTDWEKNYAEFLKLQAEHVSVFDAHGFTRLIVAIAPTELTQTVAQMVMRSWEAVPSVVCTVCETEADALSILGVAERTVADLLQTA